MAKKNPYAVALGRRGGRVTSEAKAQASRANALKGGRKPKFNVGDRVIGREEAPASYRELKGTIVERGPGRAEYGVRFDEDTLHYVMSWWIDPAH
jgi:hypothetical protein